MTPPVKESLAFWILLKIIFNQICIMISVIFFNLSTFSETLEKNNNILYHSFICRNKRNCDLLKIYFVNSNLFYNILQVQDTRLLADCFINFTGKGTPSGFTYCQSLLFIVEILCLRICHFVVIHVSCRYVLGFFRYLCLGMFDYDQDS